MALILGALACVRRGYWGWTGILLALAVTSEQFALLVLTPLAVIALSNRRVRFFGAAVATATVILAPLIVITSGWVMGAVLLGSGN
jgi:uncharacterized membrane protein